MMGWESRLGWEALTQAEANQDVRARAVRWQDSGGAEVVEAAEYDRVLDALRYIAGYDVPGYDAHLRPEEVARAALGEGER